MNNPPRPESLARLHGTSDDSTRKLRSNGPLAWRAALILALLLILILASTILLPAAPEQRLVSIYSNVANYSLPLTQHGGADYAGLLEILEPLGAVSARTDKGVWKLRYNRVESQFTPGKTHARIQGKDFDLGASFMLDGSRGLVPLSCLSTLLPRILGGPVTFNLNARRLFIGSVAVHFTAQVIKTASPQLVMNFTSSVNPMISTEPGKLRMVFTHEPLVAPGSESLSFDSKAIPSASFQESNGAAEVVVNGTVPLMATFSNDGRTITISTPQAAMAQLQQSQPGSSTAPAPTTPAVPGPAAPGASVPRSYFAVVDAAHGGEERGAALSDQLAEKDITLAFARRLHQELNARDLPTRLLRDADVTLTPDQRAGAANSSGAAIYISVHATSQGTGVRVYTALMPSAGASHGSFLDWDSAQASFLATSRVAALAVAAELRNKQIPVRILIAPLRPLTNLTTAAIAIEVAPPATDLTELNAAAYQGLIANAVALGVADIRGQLRTSEK